MGLPIGWMVALPMVIIIVNSFKEIFFRWGRMRGIVILLVNIMASLFVLAPLTLVFLVEVIEFNEADMETFFIAGFLPPIVGLFFALFLLKWFIRRKKRTPTL